MKGVHTLLRAARFDVTRIALQGLLSVAACSELLCRDARADTQKDTVAAAASPRTGALDDATPADDIIVTAARYGEARVKAETEFSEETISTFGADSVQDLLTRMAPHIDPGGEEPVILIDGQPAGFDRSVLSYPAEALERLAVLPSEASARYGHGSSRRVVNLVLKKDFSSLNVDAGLTWATRGGRYGGKLSAGRLVISRPTRWNVQGRIEADSALRRSARNIPPRSGPVDTVGYVSGAGGSEIDPALSRIVGEAVTHAAIPPEALAGTPTLDDFAATAHRSHPADPNDFETLIPSRRNISFSAGASRPLGGFSASLNLNASSSTSRGQRGLPMASVSLPTGSPWSPFANDIMLTRPFAGEQPLRDENSSTMLGLALTLSREFGEWQANFSANYTRSWSRNRLETGIDAGRIQDLVNTGDPGFNPYGPWNDRLLLGSRSRSQGENIDSRLIVMRTIATLPAGPLSTSAAIQASGSRTDSWQSSTLDGPMTRFSSTRKQASGQLTLSVPLSSRARSDFLPLGDLSVDMTMGGQTSSDRGQQKRFGSDVTWSPFTVLHLRGSFEHMETAPSFSQLDAPVISTITRIYDYSRQEMAQPVWITGGNPDLRRGTQENFSLNAMVRPMGNQTLTLNVGYRQQVAKGGVAAFPQLTPAIEAAFPERVTRDAQGRLIAVDARAINIAHHTTSELMSGITLAWQATQKPGKGAGKNAGSDAGQDTGRSRPANPVMVTASLSHHWRLKDELLTRSGIPPINQLGEDGGQSPHMVSLQITAGKQGLGATLNGSWTGGARLRGTTAAGDFRLKPSAIYNLSMHIEPHRVFDSLIDQKWATNVRISFDIQNLFDSYRRVTLSDGSIPAGYSRDEIDPLGRTVRLTLQKRF